jgi:UDPglucose--hexose-1-phosphate uridylyltransferase
VEFRREPFTAEWLDPRRGFARTPTSAEVRWDPLTGQSCRLLPEGSLPPPVAQDLAELADESRASCPFCAERIDHETPLFPAEVSPSGRIRVGDAVLFPNLVPYAKWSSVSVYSPERHLLPLDELTPRLIGDNLTAQVEFARAVVAHDPDSAWVSINANQLPPAGSSIFHPHLQGSAHPLPTSAQRQFAELEPGRVRAYLEREREAGERLIGSSGPVEWLASFAPVGLAEIRAFLTGATSIVDVDQEAVAAVASGLSAVFRLYSRLGFQGFNLALHGAAVESEEPMSVLRVVGRAYVGPLQRSDVMWSERLHAELATDLKPETVADLARGIF